MIAKFFFIIEIKQCMFRPFNLNRNADIITVLHDHVWICFNSKFQSFQIIAGFTTNIIVEETVVAIHSPLSQVILPVVTR